MKDKKRTEHIIYNKSIYKKIIKNKIISLISILLLMVCFVFCFQLSSHLIKVFWNETNSDILRTGKLCHFRYMKKEYFFGNGILFFHTSHVFFLMWWSGGGENVVLYFFFYSDSSQPVVFGFFYLLPDFIETWKVDSMPKSTFVTSIHSYYSVQLVVNCIYSHIGGVTLW